MAKRLKFPEPKHYKPEHPAVFCPAQRVIGLYTQDSGNTAKKIAKRVRTWFSNEAHRRGWAGVHFLPEVQSNFGAGCVLWRPPEKINVSIRITKSTLVLHEIEEE